eukprot:1574075-Lingulodinium_polyedra.AAC.1
MSFPGMAWPQPGDHPTLSLFDAKGTTEEEWRRGWMGESRCAITKRLKGYVQHSNCLKGMRRITCSCCKQQTNNDKSIGVMLDV